MILMPREVARLVILACTAATLVLPLPAIAAESDDRLDWWREARFGLFIHWGLYAIPAGEWNGDTDHGEWIMHTAEIPVPEYEGLASQFNPVAFNADEWVRLAKSAGMRYVVVTTKHHDGFALFDSAASDYDIMNTPFKRDVMGELAGACRRHGLDIGWYHSIMDWHHPDYLPRRDWDTRPADEAAFERYTHFLHTQVTELLTNYGDIGVMWFDGEWEDTWTHVAGTRLYDLCRALQPRVIVNNRVDKGRDGVTHAGTHEGFLGDFGTPEQNVPPTGLPGIDWETCMTMNRHWGYNAQDDQWKSTDDLIRTLVDVVSKGGNFLLNVGPRADGTFPPEAVERLRGIGEWMDLYGESIYWSTASPFENLPWGRCTVRKRSLSNVLFFHVFDWPADGRLVIPGLGNDPVRAWRLDDPVTPLSTSRGDGVLNIEVPTTPPHPVCSVIAVEITGEPVIFNAPRIVASSDIFVRPMKVTIESSSPDLETRFTTDGTDPTPESPRYWSHRPIELEETTTIRTQAFYNGSPVSDVVERTFTQVRPRSGILVQNLEPGIRFQRFEGSWDVLPDFGRMVPIADWTEATIGLQPPASTEGYGLRISGFFQVPWDDAFEFSLTSDDGSRLWVDGQLVIDNDGLHEAETVRGVAALSQGNHSIIVDYFNKTGEATLDLRCGPLGYELRPIPASMLSRPAIR